MCFDSIPTEDAIFFLLLGNLASIDMLYTTVVLHVHLTDKIDRHITIPQVPDEHWVTLKN